MSQFIQKYEEKITGTLSGWDRIVFRGTLRMLCFADGMTGYLTRGCPGLKCATAWSLPANDVGTKGNVTRQRPSSAVRPVGNPRTA